MGSFSIPRFKSLHHAPFETREHLRDRFRYNLQGWQPYIEPPVNISLDDYDVLQLLLAIEIFPSQALPVFQGHYERLRHAQGNHAPSFDEMMKQRWLLHCWGEVHWPPELADTLQHAPPHVRNALLPLLQIKHEIRYILGGGPNSEAVMGWAERVGKAQFPRSPSPEWVTARLWEVTVDKYSDPLERLTFWVERWELLDCPHLDLSRLRRKYAEAFTQAALRRIACDPGLLDWVEERRLRCVTLAIEHHTLDTSELESHIPQAPNTWLGRDAWLDRPEFGALRPIENPRQRISNIVRTLLVNVAEQSHARAPHETVKALIKLANKRPALMTMIKGTIRNRPELLADIVLIPEVAAWAAKIIASSPLRDGGFDAALISGRASTGRSDAFADALSVALHFGSSLDAVVNELAELARWLFGSLFYVRRWGHNIAFEQTELATFMLASHELGHLRLMAMVQSLAEVSGAASDCGSLGFTAALELAAVNRLYEMREADDPEKISSWKLDSIATTYTNGIRDGADLEDLDITNRAAYGLARIAQTAGGLTWENFLMPLSFNSKARDLLALADDERRQQAEKLEKSIRAHLRTLCRALQGWEGTAPEELCSAVINIFRTGNQDNPRAGRVAAFLARYENSPIRAAVKRPLATDLAFAACRMPPHSHKAFVGAAIELDDPLVLAQLLHDAPEATRRELAERLEGLTPDFASETHTTTELRSRIDAILALGLTKLAAKYIERESESSRGGESELARYQWRLKMDYFEQKRIDPSEFPANFPEPNRREAQRSLQFYSALQHLTLPGGNASKAAELFRSLSQDYSYAPTYALNWFAALTQEALGSETLLSPAEYEQSRILATLTTGEEIYERVSAHLTAADRRNYAVNRALLLLAGDEPRRVLDEFQVLPPEARESAQISIYTAVALSRLGLRSQAKAQLELARSLYGDHVLTQRVLEVLSSGGDGLPGLGSVAINLTDDHVQRIRDALRVLLSVEPEVQAKAYDTADPNSSVEILLSRLVRATGSDFMNLAPLIRDGAARPHEDDLSELFMYLLGARIETLGWVVKDQSRGGHTGQSDDRSAGRGERDLVLVKGSSRSLALFEAIVVDRSPQQSFTDGDLRMHFKKMFAYDRCCLYFLIIYSYTDDYKGVVELVKDVCTDSPEGWTCLPGVQTEAGNDNWPSLTVATYQSDMRNVRVFQLVLDCKQHLAKRNAEEASKHNPRKKKVTSGS